MKYGDKKKDVFLLKKNKAECFGNKIKLLKINQASQTAKKKKQEKDT